MEMPKRYKRVVCYIMEENVEEICNQELKKGWILITSYTCAYSKSSLYLIFAQY